MRNYHTYYVYEDVEKRVVYFSSEYENTFDDNINSVNNPKEKQIDLSKDIITITIDSKKVKTCIKNLFKVILIFITININQIYSYLVSHKDFFSVISSIFSFLK